MQSNALGYSVFAVLLLLGLVQIGYHYSQLPCTTASHFNASGRADGWMSKDAFVISHAILLAGFCFFVVMMRLMIFKLPDSVINLPHREYWLAPERSQETRSMIFRWMLWFINATGLFSTTMLELAYQANLGHPEWMVWLPWVFLAMFVIFTIIWSVLFVLRFQRMSD